MKTNTLKERVANKIGQIFIDCFTKKARTWDDVKVDIEKELETLIQEAKKEERERIVEILDKWKAETDDGSKEIDKIFTFINNTNR